MEREWRARMIVSDRFRFLGARRHDKAPSTNPLIKTGSLDFIANLSASAYAKLLPFLTRHRHAPCRSPAPHSPPTQLFTELYKPTAASWLYICDPGHERAPLLAKNMQLIDTDTAAARGPCLELLLASWGSRGLSMPRAWTMG